MRNYLVVLALLASVGCGAGAHQAAARAAVELDSAVVVGFEVFDASLDTRCDAGVIPAEACKVLNKLSVPVYDGAIALHDHIAEGTPLKELPELVEVFKEAGSALQEEVSKLTPEQGRDILREALLKLINRYLGGQ